MSGDESLRPCPNPRCDRWVKDHRQNVYCCETCIPDYEPCLTDATATSHSSWCEERYATFGPIPAAMMRRRAS